MFLTHDERKISLIAGLILIALTLSKDVYVDSIMQQQIESTFSAGLEVALRDKVHLLEYQIQQGVTDTQEMAAYLLQTQDLELLKLPTHRQDGLVEIEQTANKLLQNNFSGIIVYDNNRNEAVKVGKSSKNSALTLNLKSDPGIYIFLLWDDQFILRIFMNITNQAGQYIGSVLTELYLPALTDTFARASLIGKTGDFMLCVPVIASNLEMDCFLRGIIQGNGFKRVQRIMSSMPLPMHYALEGKFGIELAKDYRQVPVVAAYAPLIYGLGTVLKIDVNELYQPIINQIKTIPVYFALVTLSSILMLYWLMIPLARKLVKSEQEIPQSNTELLDTEAHTEQAFNEQTAYIDAIGELALISIASRKGRILEANKKFCEVSGYSLKELLGQDYRILKSGAHSREFFFELWTTIAHGKTWRKEICNRRKNATLFWLDTTIVPLKDKTKQVDRYLSVGIDVTERKKKDIELQERLKENTCFQAIRRDLGLDFTANQICQKILEHLMQALQFPESSAALIELDNKRFVIGKYNENHMHGLKAQIIVDGKTTGQLQALYIKGFSFMLPEEQNLIDTIASDLGRWIERKQTEQRILYLATHDALTDLPNRVLLQDHIQQVLAHNSRSQEKMAVLFIDLDHFKIVNDSLGHVIGDRLLKVVAERLIAAVRNEDTVARQGGDEFIVVLHSIASAPGAGTVAQKILDTLSQPCLVDSHELHIGGSIGIAVFPEDGEDACTLLKHSDIAMYHAKASGRNNYQFFTAESNQPVDEKHNLSVDLRYALKRNEMVLHYQPIINMPGSKLQGIEVLLSWQHPEYGLIPSDKIIPLAEESGQIIPIGEWTLRTMCEQIKIWQAQGYDVPRLSVNLSARQLLYKMLTENIERILHETGVEARLLTLEVAESALNNDVEKAAVTFNHLSNMGLEIAIDNFGTGYSSFGYLKRFPTNLVKIDRSFIQDIVSDSNDYAIVTAIIAMANSLGVGIIAEGVETEDQLNLLLQQGCKYFQGNYFSKPLPVTEIEGRLIRVAIHPGSIN